MAIWRRPFIRGTKGRDATRHSQAKGQTDRDTPPTHPSHFCFDRSAAILCGAPIVFSGWRYSNPRVKRNLRKKVRIQWKRNLTVLLLVLALALSLVSPAMAVESEDTSAPVTWGELTADSPDLTLPVTGEPDQAVTNQGGCGLPAPLGGHGREPAGHLPR